MIRAVESLIARGHSIDAILYDYTLDQVTAYHEAAVLNESEKMRLLLRGMAVSMRAAYHAKNRDFQSYVKSLEDTNGNEVKKKNIEEAKRLAKTGKI